MGKLPPISTTLQALLRLLLWVRVNGFFPFSFRLLSAISVARVWSIPDLFSSFRWETTVGLCANFQLIVYFVFPTLIFSMAKCSMHRRSSRPILR